MVGTQFEVDDIARICHETNRAYALVTGENPASIYPPWEECPEEVRESARVGVRGVLAGDTPEDSHERWCAAKRNAGWIYGPVSDNEAKLHTCLVPFSDLPILQRRKDYLFHGLVKSLSSDAIVWGS